MPELATTKMSSKGQVVIPENVRTKLGLRTGHQFIVVGGRNTVVLKSVEPPSMKDFDGLIAQARAQTRHKGLSKKDVLAAIARVRSRK